MSDQQNVNFLPEDYVEKRAAHRAAIVFIGLFLAVMGGIVTAYFLTERERSTVQTQLERVNQELDRKGKELAEYKEMQKEKESMYAKAEVTAQLMERVHRSTLLTGIVKCLPSNTQLTLLELKTKDAPNVPRAQTKLEDARKQLEGAAAAEPPAPQAEVTIDVTGLAPSHEHVAMFIDKLGKFNLVQDAKPLFSEEFKRENEVLRRFKVTMKLNPDADTRVSDARSTKTDASR